MNEEGGVDVEAPLRKDSQVAFEWRARGEGFDETSQVTLKCDNANRGVPLPPSWKTSLRCLSLPDLAEKSAHVAREGGVREARCVVLGQPKPSPLPEPGAALQPGAVVLLGQRSSTSCAPTWKAISGFVTSAASRISGSTRAMTMIQ